MEYDAIQALQRLTTGDDDADDVKGHLFGSLSSATPTYRSYRLYTAPTIGTWGAGVNPDG